MVDRSRIRLVRSPAGGEELRLPLGELGALLDASFVMAAALRVEPDADSRDRCRGGNNPHHGRGFSGISGGGSGGTGGEDRRYRDGRELCDVDDKGGDVDVASWRGREGESRGVGGGGRGGCGGGDSTYRQRQPSRTGGWSADGHRGRGGAHFIDTGRHGALCREPPPAAVAMAVGAADVTSADDSQWGGGDKEHTASRRRGRGGGRPGGVGDPASASGGVFPRCRSRPSASPRRRTLRIEIWEEGDNASTTNAAATGGGGSTGAASAGGAGVGASPVWVPRGAVIHEKLPPAYRDQYTNGGDGESCDNAGNVGTPGRVPRGTVLHEVPPPATCSRCTDECCGGSARGSGSGGGSGSGDNSDVTPPRRRAGASSGSGLVAVPHQEENHATLARWQAHHTAQLPALRPPPRVGTAPVARNGVCSCMSRQPAKTASLVSRGGGSSHQSRGSGRGAVVVGAIVGGGGGGGGGSGATSGRGRTIGDGWRVAGSPISSKEAGGTWTSLPPDEDTAATAVASAATAYGGGHWPPAVSQQRGEEVWGDRGIFQVRSCHDATGVRSGGGGRNGGDGGSSRGGKVVTGSRGGGQPGGGGGDSRRHVTHDLNSLDASPVASSPEASLDLPVDARSTAQMARAAAMALGEDGGGGGGAHRAARSRQDGGREWAAGRFVSGFRSLSTPLMEGPPPAGAAASIPPTDTPTSRPTDSTGLPSLPLSLAASVRRASHDSGVPLAAASAAAAGVGRTPMITPAEWGGRGAAPLWRPPPPPPPAKRSAWLRGISRRLLARGRRVVGGGGGSGGDGCGGGGGGLKKGGGGGGDSGDSGDGTVGLSLVVRLPVAVAAVEAAAAAVDGGFSVTATSTSADAHMMRCTKRVAVAGASHVMVATIRVARLGGTSPHVAMTTATAVAGAAAGATAAAGTTTLPHGGRSGRQQSCPPGRAATGRPLPADPGVTVTVRRPREDRKRTDFWRYARLAREVAAWLDATVPGCVMEAPVMA